MRSVRPSADTGKYLATNRAAGTAALAEGRFVRKFYLVNLVAVLLVACVPSARAGHVVTENGRYKFIENFAWTGNHAATIGSAPNQATTVWLDESSWDARGDTAYISITPLTDDGVALTNKFHVDIHKAAAADPRNGVLSNTSYTIGGDGSPGIGIMHLDYQDIVSARLRNPMLIDAAQPGVVRFYAPIFNTTGHWIEVALTPANQLFGGEHTSVPSVNSGLPTSTGASAQPGPGHEELGPEANSINFIAVGTADYACRGFPGWRTRFGVSKTVAGAKSHYVTPGVGEDEYLSTNPTQANTLVLWELRFYPDRVELALDLDGDGQVTPVESWPASVPWTEVFVHLIAVGYQSTHHPDDECNLGHIREVQWRNFSAYPVKYARTDVFPKNVGTQQVPKDLGFTRLDLRDIQRRGAVNGVPQPNDENFDVAHPGKYCLDAGYPCFRIAPTSITLPFSLAAGAPDGLLGALLVADFKDADSAGVHASASATLNGQPLGRFPEHDAVLPQANGEWVRRAVPVAAAALRAGATPNELVLALETGVYVDRIELELHYGASTEALFADGFETPTGTAAKASHFNRGAIAHGLTSPLFPVGPGPQFLHQCMD